VFEHYNTKRFRKPTFSEVGTIFGVALLIMARFVKSMGRDALYFSPLVGLAALFALLFRISRREDEL
jgi:VIT1/CCC1 family predicted Fe2+/Mn2+ transporter